MPLAAEFGVAADAAATKVLEAKAHAVVVLVQFVHSDLHLLLVCQRAAQTGQGMLRTAREPKESRSQKKRLRRRVCHLHWLQFSLFAQTLSELYSKP